MPSQIMEGIAANDRKFDAIHSDCLFQLAFESAAVGMGMLRPDGTWIVVNQAMCNFFGYERAELLRLSVGELTHPEDRADTMKQLRDAGNETIGSCQLEKRYLHKTGSTLWAYLAVTLVREPGGAPILVGQVQDITKKKSAEEALLHSEALFRTIGDNAGDLILIVSVPSLITEYASPTFGSLLGYSPGQLIGNISLDLIHSSDHALVATALGEVLNAQTNASIVQVRFKDAHGALHFVEAHGCAIRNDVGQVARVVVIGRIVDDRITIERKLKAREQQLQLVLDSTAEGIFGLDLEGNFAFCNHASVTMLGYTNELELLGKNVHTLTHHSQVNSSTHSEACCPLRSGPRNEIPVHADDEVFWRSDGSSFPVEYWSHPMWNGTELAGCVVTFLDITRRKATQASLRNAHNQAELFINSVPSILISLNDKGQIARWNSSAAQTFGLEAAEVLGKPLESCGVKWHTPDLGTKIRVSLDRERPIAWDDIHFEKDGRVRILGLNSSMIRAPGSKDTEFLLIVGADITDRRQAEEDLRFKTAFLEAQSNATIDGILVVDANGKAILQNQRFLQIFDIPPSLRDCNDDAPLLRHVLHKIKNSEQFLQKVEYLYQHIDATSRDEIELENGTILDRFSSPVLGKEGKYYGRIWFFRDMTRRKQDENALRQLSSAVEQSPVSVVITNLNGEITYVNPRFTDCTGYTFEEVRGQNPRLLQSGRTPDSDYKHLWETITAGREWRGELCNKKKNGELYWEFAAISPIKDVNGKTTHFLAVKEDVTERKMMEGQLRQVQKLEAIGQLAAGIAHEINTPMQFIGDNTRFVREAWTSLDPLLSTVQSFSESKTSQAVSPDPLTQLRGIFEARDFGYIREEVPRALDQSLEGIDRVSKIVQAMKEFSHPGSDEKHLTDINKAISTTVTVARNEWKYVADVETILADNLGMVPCHAGELHQVLLNLLINSAHAIGEVVGNGGQNKGKITIRTWKDNDATNISIQDTGAGIPVEIGSRVFDPFFTTKAVGKGSGQGLALAYASIVKKHDGRIWFESDGKKGTTFYIQLPMSARTT